MKKILTRNTNLNWLLVNRFITMPFEIAVGIMMARYYGPENLGKISLAMSVTTILAVAATFGVDNVAVKNIVERRYNLNSIMGTVLGIRIFGAFIAAVSANLYSLLRIDDIMVRWMIFILSLGYFFQSFKNIDFYFQAIAKCKYTVISQKISAFSGYILKMVAILKNFHIVVMAVITVYSDIVLAFFNIYFFRKKNNEKSKISEWSFNRVLFKEIIKICWPLALSALAAQIYIKIDVVLLGELSGAREVGIYASSVRLLSVWYFITTALGAVFYPKLVTAKSTSYQHYKNFLQFYYIIMFWLSISIALFITFTSDFFVEILYGEAYIESILPLSISAWSLTGTFVGMAVNHYLTAEGYTIIILVQTLIGSVLNLIANFILIPKYGVSGAAVATVISYNLSTLSFLIFKKTSFSSFLLLNVLNPRTVSKSLKRYISRVVNV